VKTLARFYPMLWLEQLLISIKIATVLKLGGKTEKLNVN
jgi:hypothetical protein